MRLAPKHFLFFKVDSKKQNRKEMLNAMEAERKERAFELDEVVVTFAFGNEG